MLAFFAALLAAAAHPGHMAQPTVPVTPAPAAPAPDPASPAPAPETATVPKVEPDASPPLETASPWWEKITVTVDGQGKQASCRYETNLKRAESCDEAMAASIKAGGKGSRNGVFSKVTFERRFSPGGKPDAAPMQPGDTLLGRQVMHLTIDAAGDIAACKIVSSAGDVPPDYGCAEARKEKFAAAASADAAAAARQAFMTVTAYGHTESIA